MRGLVAAELVVTVLIGALLLTSPTTFAYYRFGELAHELIAALVFVLARRRAYWMLIGVSAISLPIALIVLPEHFGALDLLLILWTLAVLPLIAAGLIGRQMEAGVNVLRREVLIVVIVVGCAVNLRSIREFPNFSATDEAIIFNYVDTFKRTGQIGASLIPYNASIVTGNLYIYGAALWTDVFPNDPFALRDFSALGGLLLIAVVFLTARALRDALTGWIAAALLATNLLWTAVAHIGRQEIWLAVFVWTAVWLSLEAKKCRSLALALLAGIVVALSADVHPLGAYACIALGVWWLVSARRERRLLLTFVSGGLIGTAYYLWTHVLPDPAYFFAGIRDELVSYGAEGSNPLSAMLARHANYLASNPLEFGLLLICSAWAIRRADNRRLGLLIGVLFALYGLTVADPNLYYPIVWITGMVILSALTVRSISSHWRSPLLVAFLGAFALNAVLIEHQVGASWNERALGAIEEVATRVPVNGHGTGESFLYLALRDPKFIGFTFVNFWADSAGISKWEVVQTLQPEWIVRVQDESAFTPPFNTLSVDVPHMSLGIPAETLEQAYRLSDSIPTSVGTFEIWKKQES